MPLTDNGGWFGYTSHVLRALALAGADANADGDFYVAGRIVFAGGDREVSISPDAVYLKDGREHSLPTLLGETPGETVRRREVYVEPDDHRFT